MATAEAVRPRKAGRPRMSPEDRIVRFKVMAYLLPDLHRRLIEHVDAQDTSMAQVLERALILYLDRFDREVKEAA